MVDSQYAPNVLLFLLKKQNLYIDTCIQACMYKHKHIGGEQALEDLHLENKCNKVILLDLQSCSLEVICSIQTVIGVYFHSISRQNMQGAVNGQARSKMNYQTGRIKLQYINISRMLHNSLYNQCEEGPYCPLTAAGP